MSAKPRRASVTPLKDSPTAGFTIVELLIVIIVIGILATLTLIAYNGFNKQAHESVLVADLKNGDTKLEASRAGGATYPIDQTAAGIQASQGNAFTYNPSSDSSDFCLQASGFGETYYITSTSQLPVAGVCNGSVGVSGSAPSLVATTFAPIGSGSAASVNVPLPSASTGGSLIILYVFAEYNTSTAGSAASNFTIPSNFTMVNSITTNEFSNTFQELAAVYYGYTSASDTNYTVGYKKIGAVSPNDEWASASLVTGAKSGNPFVDSFHQIIQKNNISNNFTFPSFTTGGDNSLIFLAVGDPGNITETTYGAPSGWVKSAGGAGPGNYGTIFYKNQSTAGAIGDTLFTSDRNDGKYIIAGTIR